MGGLLTAGIPRLVKMKCHCLGGKELTIAKGIPLAGWTGHQVLQWEALQADEP